MTWTHDNLQTDLAQHLRSSRELMTWENMQLGPSGSPRPDVYAIGKTYKRFAPLAYECKISVADYRRDVTTGKWQSYLKYAAAVIFAVPAGLIDKKDVPAGCGLMVRSDSGWRALKGPTLNHFETLPIDAWMKLMIDGIGHQVKRYVVGQRYQGNQWTIEQAVRKKFGDSTAELIRRALHARDSVQRAIDEDVRRRKEIEDGTDQFAKAIQDQVRQQAGRLDDAQRSLATTLGLPATADARALSSAIYDAVHRLGQDDELNRLRRLVDSLESTLREAKKPLPGSVSA